MVQCPHMCFSEYPMLSFHTRQFCAAKMKATSALSSVAPTLLLLSSYSGVVGLAHRAAYSSSKFALNGYLESVVCIYHLPPSQPPCLLCLLMVLIFTLRILFFCFFTRTVSSLCHLQTTFLVVTMSFYPTHKRACTPCSMPSSHNYESFSCVRRRYQLDSATTGKKTCRNEGLLLQVLM